MEPVTALEKTFDHMHGVTKAVTAAQLGNATPCREWDTRALLTHAATVVAGMSAAITGQQPAPVALDESDIAGQFRRIADETLAAWRIPGTLDRELDAGAGPMPGAQYAVINTLDTLVHAWDVAKATGQDPILPSDLAEYTLPICQGFITDDVRKFAGFDPAVPVAATASASDRLVAFLGRRP